MRARLRGRSRSAEPRVVHKGVDSWRVQRDGTGQTSPTCTKVRVLDCRFGTIVTSSDRAPTAHVRQHAAARVLRAHDNATRATIVNVPPRPALDPSTGQAFPQTPTLPSTLRMPVGITRIHHRIRYRRGRDWRSIDPLPVLPILLEACTHGDHVSRSSARPPFEPLPPDCTWTTAHN